MQAAKAALTDRRAARRAPAGAARVPEQTESVAPRTRKSDTGGPPTQLDTSADAVTAMLEARSVALVGASGRAGSLGARMIAEVARSPARPMVGQVLTQRGNSA
jgi:hypothetical protein